MNQVHLCLADPASGRSAPGDQADCPQCRRVLLLSFLVPADAPEVIQPPATDGPHLMVPDRFTRSLELRPPADPDPGPPDTRTHVTEHGIEPDPDQPGGEWFARCTCGWSETGHYNVHGPRSGQVAGRLAKLKALKHREENRG